MAGYLVFALIPFVSILAGKSLLQRTVISCRPMLPLFQYFEKFCILLIIQATENCTAGWEELGEMCYYFSSIVEETTLTYYESQDWCLRNGGHLISIHDMEEVNFILNKVWL